MPRYWLAIGSRENWLTAFEYGNIWGLKARQRNLWNNISERDTILFYVTSDVRGLVGHGRVRSRFKQDTPLWPLEVLQGKVIWPFRIEFDVESCLAPDQWRSAKVRPGLTREVLRTGLQEVDSAKAQRLLDEVELAAPRKDIPTQPTPAPAERGPTGPTPIPTSVHDELQAKLAEIGRLQRFLAETEFKLDGEKLDVVWRRVERSVPTYVFEIHVGGDIYHALGKLKHAFDLWNSHIFLVAGQQETSKIDQLLSGTFHEIRQALKFLPLDKVMELHRKKTDYHELEQQLGIM